MSFFADLQLWRLIGAASWHAPLCVTATASFLCVSGLARSLFSFSALSALLFLYILQLCVLVSHRKVVSSSEVQILHLPWLGIGGQSLASAFISRVFLRGRCSSDWASVGLLYGTAAVCCTAYLSILPALASQTRPPLSWTLWAGTTISAVYCTSHLVWCKDVLTYPLVQRHRYFRIKGRLIQILASALRLTALGLACALVVAGVPDQLSSLPALAASAWLCIVSWLLGHAALEVVLTERVQLAAWGEPDPNKQLIDGLANSDALIQDLALLDLACFSEDRGTSASAARRAALFADETGRAAWAPVAGCLVGELRTFVSTLAAGLPSSAGGAGSKAANGGKGGSGGGALSLVQWNAMSLSSSSSHLMGGGARQLKREQDVAAWTVRSKLNRVGWSLRALSGLAAASRQEDRYGVVLLCEPTLADMLAALLSTILVLQQFAKSTNTVSSRSPWPKGLQRLSRLLGTSLQVEHAAFALEDLARTCTYRVIAAFGPSLKGTALKDMRLSPVYGSPSDLLSLLNGMLSYSE